MTTHLPYMLKKIFATQGEVSCQLRGEVINLPYEYATGRGLIPHDGYQGIYAPPRVGRDRLP